MPIDDAVPKKAAWVTFVTYLKAASFLAPPLLIWTAITIFVAPKMKQICADSGQMAGSGPFAVFKVMDFAQENALLLTIAAIAIIVLLEWKSELWRHWRKYSIGTVVFLINTAVIVGLASLLFVAAIVAPMLSQR